MSDLCPGCNGNGVVKVPGGVSVCVQCQGKGWANRLAELDTLRQQVASLTEERDRLKAENARMQKTSVCPSRAAAE